MESDILKREEQAAFALRGLYRSFGYLPYKMSRFEEYELYVRNKDFLVSDQFITFSGANGKLLALKPDVTLSIIKNSPDRPGSVQKLYYNENVYRAQGNSGIKEILQTGLECVGDLGSYEIAEVVLLAAKSMALLGGKFVLNISHMGLIAAVLEACKVPEPAKAEVMRCLRQKNGHELATVCQSLVPEAAEKLQAMAALGGRADGVLRSLDAMLVSQEERQALEELKQLVKILNASGYGDAIRLDFSVGNDMKYYSGVVFKGYLEDIPASILSGGQYDKLLKKMGRGSRAIGFALYLDLLERQGTRATELDVDTLILHDGTLDPAALVAAAEEAAAQGTVLVATEVPQGRAWGRLVDMRRGGNG